MLTEQQFTDAAERYMDMVELLTKCSQNTRNMV